jgi:hypothetical protein
MKARHMPALARPWTTDQICDLHGFHRTPTEVGKGGFPFVAQSEDETVIRPDGLEHI